MRKATQARSVATKERILDAAVAQFRAHGFRGAGIAGICKAAEVSAGHLYHHFDGKEAIVAAIVARDRTRFQNEIARLLANDDPIEALVDAMLSDHREADAPTDPALAIEVYAEASRNPTVAAIVRDFERAAMGDVVAMLAALKADGRIAEGCDLAAAAHVLMALGDGLMVRALAEPGTDPAALAATVRAAVRAVLLEGPPQK